MREGYLSISKDGWYITDRNFNSCRLVSGTKIQILVGEFWLTTTVIFDNEKLEYTIDHYKIWAHNGMPARIL